jgi:hypothetical protein
LVSFATAPYGAWPFDLVLLLLPILQQAARLVSPKVSEEQIWRGVAWFGAIDAGMAGMKIAQVDSYWFVWVAPALLLAHQNLVRTASRAGVEATSAMVPPTGSAVAP